MRINESGVSRVWWDEAFTQQGHTGWADRQVYRYDQPLRRAAVRRVLHQFYPHGLNGALAVDVGCGTGDFVGLLLDKGACVIGFDFSGTVLATAQRRFAGQRDRVELCCASVTDIPVPTASALVVTSITVLQHLVTDHDFQRGVQELRRILRSDGRIVVIELAPDLACPAVGSDGHVIERPPALWRAAFRAHGLEVEHEAVYPQLGITLLRGLAKLIDKARGGARPNAATRASVSPSGRPGALRRLVRNALSGVRAATLLVARPFDYLIGVQMPVRNRYYRLWVLRISRGERGEQ